MGSVMAGSDTRGISISFGSTCMPGPNLLQAVDDYLIAWKKAFPVLGRKGLHLLGERSLTAIRPSFLCPTSTGR